jgi:circadian clock protein KaiC
LVLEYKINGGERNRALSVVKSRGSAHSNQVREMILSSDGIELQDIYEFGSEVLMGTARIQKQNEERANERRRGMEHEQRKRLLAQQLAHAKAETQRLELELGLQEEEIRARQENAGQTRAEVLAQRTRNQQVFETKTGNRTQDR